MTVRLLLLKSGEDIIADVKEMVVGDTEESRRVVGYFLHKPCVVKMSSPANLFDEKTKLNTTPFKVSLFPWMPLSKDKTIPVSADWVVTMVTPSDKLNQMYNEDVINYGKDNQSNSVSQQTDSNQSD
jgi:hypothetical protein